MTNEAVKVDGTPKTLEANGGSVTSDTVAQANDASYGIVADGASFPHALFVLTFTLASTTSVQNKTINLYARALDISSTNDAESPESGANYKGRFIGAFVVNDSGSAQYADVEAFDVPRKADYYIDNQTGQTINSGWTLVVTPFSYKPGA